MYDNAFPLDQRIVKTKDIISKIAEVKEMSFEEIESITTQNTKRLFKKMK